MAVDNKVGGSMVVGKLVVPGSRMAPDRILAEDSMVVLHDSIHIKKKPYIFGMISSLTWTRVSSSTTAHFELLFVF